MIKTALWVLQVLKRGCAKSIHWDLITAVVFAAIEVTTQYTGQSEADAGATLTGVVTCCVTSAWRTRG